MRNWYKILFLLMILTSCKDRFETIGQVPTTPGIKLFTKDSLMVFYRDSVKLSNPNYSYFGIDLRLSDSDRYYTSLRYLYEEGAGTLVSRFDTLKGDLLPFQNNRCLLRFTPVSEGLCRIVFTVTDHLNHSGKASLELFTFNNLLPVPLMQITPVRSVDPLEYLLDASGSYDADKNFGGVIRRYIYTVEGQILTTSKNQIKHIFSSQGVFTVTLQVKDNDNGLSPLFTRQISIN